MVVVENTVNRTGTCTDSPAFFTQVQYVTFCKGQRQCRYGNLVPELARGKTDLPSYLLGFFRWGGDPPYVQPRNNECDDGAGEVALFQRGKRSDKDDENHYEKQNHFHNLKLRKKFVNPKKIAEKLVIST